MPTSAFEIMSEESSRAGRTVFVPRSETSSHIPRGIYPPTASGYLTAPAVAGPDHGPGPASFPCARISRGAGRQVTLGSGEDCGCRIRHPSVSARHAALVRKPQRGVYVVDLSGDQGTYVNGERVTDRLLLMDRDRIRLGESVELTYHDGSAPNESRVRRWVKRIGVMASKTGWKS